jgi:hypothetical protein
VFTGRSVFSAWVRARTRISAQARRAAGRRRVLRRRRLRRRARRGAGIRPVPAIGERRCLRRLRRRGDHGADPAAGRLPDLAYVEAASRTLSHYLRPGATVIVESTSYPGTMQEQVLRWLEEVSGLTAGTDFHLGLQPGTHRPREPAWTLVTTPKKFLGHRRRLAGRGAGLLRRDRGRDRGGVLAARGGGRPSTRCPPSRSGSCGSVPGRRGRSLAR